MSRSRVRRRAAGNTRGINLVLAAVFGALAAGIIGPLLVSAPEVRRHNRQIEQRDEDLEEWIVVRQRQLARRLREIQQDANAKGVAGGSTIPAARVAIKTNLLYEYREELRQARAFVRNVQVEERWYHATLRVVRRRRFPELTTPDRAERLVDYWAEGTARNALTWRLDDILEELPVRATVVLSSRASIRIRSQRSSSPGVVEPVSAHRAPNTSNPTPTLESWRAEPDLGPNV